MIIELSGISVAYNCVFDTLQRELILKKNTLRGEQDEVN